MASDSTLVRVPKYTGVYRLTSSVRRHDGRPDTCFYVTYKHDGRQVKRKVGWSSEGYTAAEASRIRGDLIRAARGGHAPACRLTMAEAWEMWWRRHGRRLGTASRVKSHWESMLAPYIGRVRVNALGLADMERLRDRLLERGLAPQSIAHAVSLVRRILSKLRDWNEWSGPLPMRCLDLPRVDNARLRWLTGPEALLLLAELARRSLRTRLMAMVSLYTGARFSEIARLMGQDVRWTSCHLELRDTKHGTRTVPMGAPLAYDLRLMDTAPGRLVFPARHGGVMSSPSDAFTRAVEALGFNHGIEDRRQRVVFHTLRHTFGSWLAQAGTPMYTISRLMGHSLAETTARYAKLSPEVTEAAVRSIDSALHG